MVLECVWEKKETKIGRVILYSVPEPKVYSTNLVKVKLTEKVAKRRLGHKRLPTILVGWFWAAARTDLKRTKLAISLNFNVLNIKNCVQIVQIVFWKWKIVFWWLNFEQVIFLNCTNTKFGHAERWNLSLGRSKRVNKHTVKRWNFCVKFAS